MCTEEEITRRDVLKRGIFFVLHIFIHLLQYCKILNCKTKIMCVALINVDCEKVVLLFSHFCKHLMLKKPHSISISYLTTMIWNYIHPCHHFILYINVNFYFQLPNHYKFDYLALCVYNITEKCLVVTYLFITYNWHKKFLGGF